MQYNKALRSPRSRSRPSNAAEMSSAPTQSKYLQVNSQEQFLSEQTSQEQTFPQQAPQKSQPFKRKIPLSFERELESFSFFVLPLPTRPRKFFIIESTPLVVTVVVNFPELREQLSDGSKIIQTAQNYVFKANRRGGLHGHPHRPR